MRFLLCFIGFIGLGSLLFSQSSVYFFRTITEEQGLSQVQVNAIAQDSQGLIWIATDYGLNRFDGYSCETFQVDKQGLDGIAHNQISALFIDGNERMWMGLGNGRLQNFDIGTRKFGPATEVAPDWSGDPLIEIYQDEMGKLWVVGMLGKVWTYLPEQEEWKLEEDFTPELVGPGGQEAFSSTLVVDGQLWVHVQGGNLYQLRGDSFQLRFTQDEICTATQADSCNQWDWWFGSQYGPQNSRVAIHIPVVEAGRELCRTIEFDLESGESKILLESSALATMLYADTSRLYIRPNTKAAEVVEVDVRTGAIDTLDFEQDGIGKMLNASPLFLDKTGMLWGSYSKGVFYFDHSPPFSLFNPERSSLGRRIALQSIRSIHENPYVPGSFFISGYPSGTQLFLPGTGTIDTKGNPRSGMLSKYVFHVMVPMGENEVFTGREWSGIGRWHPNTGHIEYYTDTVLKEGKVIGVRNAYSMLREQALLWYGNNGGLYRFDLSSNERSYGFTHIRPGDFQGECNVIVRHTDGDLYVGSTMGLIRVDAQSQQSSHVDLPLALNPTINSLLSQDGNVLWIGTSDQGLLRLQLENGRIESLQQWGKGEGKGAGLADNRICGILESENILWISTFDGLSRLDLEDMSFCNYYRESGLQDNEFNRFAYHKASDGRVMFGGIGGLTVFDPGEVVPEESNPSVILSKVEKNNLSVAQTSLEENVFDLFPGDRRFLFQFTTDDYFSPSQVQFRYQISPLDTSWHTLGEDRTLVFENTRAGNYDIEVQATDRYGRWSPSSLKFRLQVHPHWYDTTAFMVACIVLGLLLSLLFGWWRARSSTRRANALEQVVEERTTEIRDALAEREVLLKEIHHRVKNNLMAIYSILSLQARRLPKGKTRFALEDARNRIHSMAKLHQQVYEFDNLEKIDFEKYVRDLVDSIQGSLGRTGTRITVDCKIAHLVVDLQLALSLGMILNELLSNAYKHAFKDRDEGRITIQLKEIGERKWELLICDDGVGLEQVPDWENLDSMGLLLVQQWVLKIKGTIEARIDQGTVFLVRFGA